jgi:hypothetical protein
MPGKSLERSPLELAESHQSTITALIEAIQGAAEIADLHEARARTEALRGWAKVHGLTKKMRLDLLRVEVEALVRIVELGGADTLTSADRRAAIWLAEQSPEDLHTLLTRSGSATTARGMCQAVWREKEVAEHNRRSFVTGMKLAQHPQPPNSAAYDEEAILAARDHANSLAGTLASIAESYISNGVEFTIEELAEEIIEAALPDDLAEDSVIRDGIRKVCADMVRRTPPLMIEGTSIPRLITARTLAGKFIRIPILNATMAHLDDMITMRQAQIEQEHASLQKLIQFAEQLKQRGADTADTRIGDIITRTVRRTDEDIVIEHTWTPSPN